MQYFIIWSFLVFIVASLAKLIYDVQQNKKKNKEVDELGATEAKFEAKEQFQKLAGIGQPKNEIDPEIWKYIADKVSKEGFPEPDPSIPVSSQPITTIVTHSESADPLSEIPMSRISKEAKKKMAEIAKEDIKEQVEKQALIFPEVIHEVDLGVTKPKKKATTKKKPNPKQMDGVKAESEFKKTRKKTTKKTK